MVELGRSAAFISGPILAGAIVSATNASTALALERSRPRRSLRAGTPAASADDHHIGAVLSGPLSRRLQFGLIPPLGPVSGFITT
jgi:hypothetical protein